MTWTVRIAIWQGLCGFLRRQVFLRRGGGARLGSARGARALAMLSSPSCAMMTRA